MPVYKNSLNRTCYEKYYSFPVDYNVHYGRIIGLVYNPKILQT